MALLEIENLTFTYPGQQAPVFRDISFSVERGDFVTVCGPTGCGKSTLLRLIKRELAPLGEKRGSIRYDGAETELLDERTSACRIGYVMQRPEQQIVTDRVWHELAFGLENMGIWRETIRRRVAEIAQYFGMEDLFERNVSELSGGQKQLLNLAAVMVMEPQLLILDEPTAQLDPVTASSFLNTVRKLNRDLSVTVLLIEHRLEEAIPISDKLLVLRPGRPVLYEDTRSCVMQMRNDPELEAYLPAVVRIFARLNTAECPLTVREGRRLIEQEFTTACTALPLPPYEHAPAPALAFEDVYFRYEREAPDVLRGLSFTVYEREICCILGGNGSGKSTALKAASGLLRPYAGRIRVFGQPIGQYKNQSLYRNCLTMLPQDVSTVFLRNTVREELEVACPDDFPYDLSGLMDRHPYDLSGGQQQLVALKKVLASKPKLLLLDEPTKGLDACNREIFVRVLRRLKEQGLTIVCVTHGVGFAASAADRCALFFRGEIISQDVPRAFFGSSCYYTTAANYLVKGRYGYVATPDDAIRILEKNRRPGQ